MTQMLCGPCAVWGKAFACKIPTTTSCFRDRRPEQHRLPDLWCQTQYFTLNQQCDMSKIPISMLPRDHTKYHTSWDSLGTTEKSKSNKLSESMFPLLSIHSNISLSAQFGQHLLQKGAEVRRLCHVGNERQKVYPNLFLTQRGKRARTNNGSCLCFPKDRISSHSRLQRHKGFERGMPGKQRADQLQASTERVGSWKLSLIQQSPAGSETLGILWQPGTAWDFVKC